jgi:predicted CDP-diglyceride synthetase/phosphatidate cytidylyltransferase
MNFYRTDKNSMDVSKDEAKYILGRFMGDEKIDKKMVDGKGIGGLLGAGVTILAGYGLVKL